MNNDAREAVADAILQGRFRYAARLLFIWAQKITKQDEHKIMQDVESYSSYAITWDWAKDMQSITIRHRGEVYSYTPASCAEEKWFNE